MGKSKVNVDTSLQEKKNCSICSTKHSRSSCFQLKTQATHLNVFSAVGQGGLVPFRKLCSEFDKIVLRDIEGAELCHRGCHYNFACHSHSIGKHKPYRLAVLDDIQQDFHVCILIFFFAASVVFCVTKVKQIDFFFFASISEAP